MGGSIAPDFMERILLILSSIHGTPYVIRINDNGDTLSYLVLCAFASLLVFSDI